MRWLIAIAIIAAAACGGRSPPTHHYGLAPAQGAIRVYSGPPLRLEAVQMPPSLDSQQMMRRTSPYAISIAQHERWSDALGYLMRQALAQNLVTRLPDGALIYPDAPKPADALGITVDVLQLVEQDGIITLDASWTILAPDAPRIVGRHQKSWKEQVSGSAASTSEGLSRILARVADDIADSLVQGDIALR